MTEQMLVDLGGRRIHPVYATAWMVRHIEEAARMLIEPHLEPGEDATGYAMTLTHERPARTGERLEIVARVSRIDDREVEAEVEILGPAGRIGRATFVQRYIDAGRFESEEDDR